ncbi:uncharacterized protein LOC124689281 [Lolium rigidum]|uniref:uncharacterized protein LOC124689281 n=1 Tax=Lolium rigidum TaxID=89674 RepID=UPI001F5D117E|nr:uncharacterized protein LOC124689281 [Lolium rigidum]
MASLPPLPEDGEVEEQAIVAEDNQGSSLPESEVAGSHKSAASHEKEIESEASESTQSLPPAISPNNKRKRNDAEGSGTSKAEKVVPSHPKAAYDPYIESLVSSDDEEEVPTVDVAPRTTSLSLLVAPAEHPTAQVTENNRGRPSERSDHPGTSGEEDEADHSRELAAAPAGRHEVIFSHLAERIQLSF